MNNIINLNIPIKGESYNQYYRIMRNRFVISKSGRKFKQEIQDYIKNKYPDFICLDCKIGVFLEFGFKDNRRRDLDNQNKSILDCLNKLIINDDSQIFELKTIKKLGQESDYILMEIYKI
jgi:Holliday junction resolvase RusA-like endonuclease